MLISPGDIVYSTAGKESGHYFVVMEVCQDFVLIYDGRKRKTDRPKKKKVKHLKTGFGRSDFLAQRIKNGEKVTNAQLKSELKPYSEP